MPLCKSVLPIGENYRLAVSSLVILCNLQEGARRLACVLNLTLKFFTGDSKFQFFPKNPNLRAGMTDTFTSIVITNKISLQ